jgi:hypothetical protein
MTYDGSTLSDYSEVRMLSKYCNARAMRRTLSVLIFAAISPMILANDFVCRSNSDTRVISVEYEQKGWQVPCKVKYEKPAESVTDYPWSARFSLGYCEDRAKFLAGKLENWGWSCEEHALESEEP